MSEVQEIAGRLTDEQRRVLIWHPLRGYYGDADEGWPRSAFDPHSFNKAGRPLMAMNLVAWHPNRRDSRTSLTPLGLQVRAHLQATQAERK